MYDFSNCILLLSVCRNADDSEGKILFRLFKSTLICQKRDFSSLFPQGIPSSYNKDLQVGRFC